MRIVSCLTRAGTEERDATLRQFSQGGQLDVRGVTISESLLKTILDAAPHGGDCNPVFTAARFAGATFECEARFERAAFKGGVNFGGTRFKRAAKFEKAMFGGTELNPGQYKVEVNEQKAVIRQGKVQSESPVKVEESPVKFDTTTVRYGKADGKTRIEEIRIGGTKTKLVFSM